MNRVVRGLLLVSTVMILTGCASALSQPMPELKGKLALVVSKELPSKWTDMPIGVHHYAETSVYVSGHQGAAGIGILFGPIGLALAHSAAQSTGEKKAAVVSQVRIDMVAATERAIAAELARRGDTTRFAPAGSKADGTLEIVPFLVLNFVGDDKVRPWIVLKTALKDANGDEKWKTRYMASVAETRTLGGDAGWVSAEAEPLRSAIDRSLQRAVDVLLREGAGHLTRGSGRAVKVKGQWVWVKQPLELSAEVLDESDELIVVKPNVSDAIVFAGVSIFEKPAVTVTAEPPK